MDFVLHIDLTCKLLAYVFHIKFSFEIDLGFQIDFC